MTRIIAAITLAGTIIGIFAGLKALEWPPFRPDRPASAIAGTPTGSTTGSGPLSSTSATTTGGSTNGSGTKPPSVCMLTISNPLVPLRSAPNPMAQEEIQVPPGTYPAEHWQNASFAGVNERWFQITVQKRTGWIEDNTIFIAQKSDACP